MKPHLIFIAFVFCAFCFGCKKDSSTIGDGLNFKTFNLPPDAVYSSQDNCFLVVDYLTGRLAKIDANGNLLWQRNDVFNSIKDQNSNYLQPIIISSQQNTCSFQCINDSIRGTQKYYHIVFTTLDNNGNIVVKKNLSTPKDSLEYNTVDFNNATSIALASGEFLYLIPNSYEYGSGTSLYHITVRKISASGNLIWEKKQDIKVAVNAGFSYNDDKFKLYSNDAASFYIIHKYSSTINRALKYSASGDFVSFKNINSQVIPNVGAYDNLIFSPLFINSIISPNNSDIIFTGSKNIVNSTTNRSYQNWFIYKFNSAFGIIKSNYFGDNRYAGVSCINSRGNIVLVGYEYTNYKSYFKASEFDSNTLEEISNNSYLETNNYAGLACVSNQDGSISVIATETFNFSTNPVHTIFFKLNADGSLIK